MGGLSIFRKKYTVRRFGEQKIVAGYATSSYQDSVTALNVQPLDPDALDPLPEGERQFKKLKVFGDFLFTAADQSLGVSGDWLYYLGRWYKCTSAVLWDHTMLAHCRSEFEAVAYDNEPEHNLKPPEVIP